MAAVIKIVVETSGGVDAVKKDVASLGDSAEKAGGGFSSLKEIATGALREIGSLAVNALGKAAEATVGFLKDSVSLAGDFQSGMLEFQAVAGKDVDTAGLDKFHDLFLQLGKDLPVSTSDVQKAAIELVKGGIDPATVAAGGLESAIKFAGAAMGGDLAAAAEVSAKVVGGWADVSATAAEKADLLTHSADLLTKAANASTVDVHDLALGLYNVQGTAKTVGLSLDETTTALAELAPRFSNANTAGTSFRNFLIRLQPTTDSATMAMRNIGLMTTDTTKIMNFLQDKGIKPLGDDLDTLGNQFTEWATAQGMTAKQIEKMWSGFDQSAFFNAKGEFVGVAEASRLLQDATAGLTDAQKTQALQTIFGNDAMNAAAAFAEMGAQGYTNMAGALDNANGVAENAALKQQGFNTAMENTKGSIEALKITLGEQFLPVLGMLLNDYIAPAINSVTTFVDAIFKAHDATGSWTAAIDQFLPGFQSVYDTAVEVGGFIEANLAPILSGLAAMTIAIVVPAFIAWATTAGTAALATITAMAPVVVPILAIGAAVGVLAAAWENDWGGIRTILTDFWNTYGQPIFEQVKTWLATNIPIAIQATSTFFTDTLLPAFQSIWAFIQDSIIPIFAALFRVEFAIAQKVGEALAGLWQNVIYPALQSVWSFIQTSVIPIFKEIGGYLSDTFGPILTNLSTWLGSVTGGFDGISSAVQGVIRWINDMADAISNIDLPDWLTPGSPTPFEYAMRGLANAFKTELNPQLGVFQTQINALPVAAPVGGGGNNTVNNYTTQNTLTFAPSYTGGSTPSLDYNFAKSLAGVV